MINKVHNMDCLEGLKLLEDNSVDSIVTDPPYELGFMGKSWDSTGIAYNVELWKQCLRVLKPGGHLLSFGGTRTYHRMTCAIEDAGFEVRDSIHWVYSQGFPKSMDISKAIDKQAGATREVIGNTGRNPTNENITAPATPSAQQWQGWGTALKPAHEIIVLARKPLSEKTIASNVLRWGVGGLNIDGCRIPLNGEKPPTGSGQPCPNGNADMMSRALGNNGNTTSSLGRFPANIILDEDAGKALDEQSGTLKSGKLSPHHGNNEVFRKAKGDFRQGTANVSKEYGGDSGGASRFFASCSYTGDDIVPFKYCAKASKADRGTGNVHSTVKPQKLMEYLVTLVTPPNGTVLDPFAGSGSTLVAAKNLGFQWIGFEMNKEYCDICDTRLSKDVPVDVNGDLC